MDLNRVTAFARVVHDGSFTAAAKALGLPKSSISRSVAQLEEDLGIRLLHRTTRKLHLTDAGVAFYERVARALSDIEEATSAATDLQAQMRGTVRVTAPADYGVWALAPIVSRFVRKHTSIRVDVSLTGRVVDLAAEGFDLAVRAGPLRESSLIARRVGSLEAALYASPKYLARKGTPKRLSDLANHECILFHPTADKGTWQLVDRDGSEKTVTVTGSVGVDDMTFVRKAILSGAGIGLVPIFLCAREEERGRVVRVLSEWGLQGSNIHVVYPSARFVPQRVVVFREYLMKELAKFNGQCTKRRAANGKASREGVSAADPT